MEPFLDAVNAKGKKIRERMMSDSSGSPIIPSVGDWYVSKDGDAYEIVKRCFHRNLEEIQLIGVVLDDEGEPLLCGAEFEHQTLPNGEHDVHYCIERVKTHPVSEFSVEEARHHCHCGISWVDDDND